MTKRDRFIEAGLIGVGAGTMGAIIGIMLNFGVKISDVFTLAGAIVGAAATVAGAIWVADHNFNSEFAKEVDVLSSDFTLLIDTAELAKSSEPHPDQVWSEGYRNALMEFGWKARGSLMIVEQAIERSRSLNFRHRASLIHLKKMLESSNDFFADCFETNGELHPMDERSWPAMISEVLERVQESWTILRRA